MQEQIEADIKAALLAGDKKKVETLRGLKSAFQYEAVSQKLKPVDLTDEQLQKVLAREAKKRTEAAELYKNAGEQERAGAELEEKAIIEKYLPEQLSEEEVDTVVKEEVSRLDNPSLADMGRIIGAVRGRLGAVADGATIARLVKQALEKQ